MKIPRNAMLQKGFTLIELMVVVLIIGVLLVVVVPSIVGSQTGSRATLIQRIADTTANNWSLLTSQAGTTTTVLNNPIAVTPGSTGVADVLYTGAAKVAPAYLAAYNSTGIRALSHLVTKDSAGINYVVAGTSNMAITLGGGGALPMTITITNAPVELVTNLVQKIQPAASILTDGTTQTVGQLSYTCPGSGTCSSIVFLRQL